MAFRARPASAERYHHHGIPSHDIVIRPGDIVSIDTGAKIDGFNGDNACTYAVGKVDLEAQRLLDVTKAALYKGIEQAVAGNRIGDIGYAVQSYCETPVSRSSASSWATAPAVSCTRTRKCPTTAIRAAVRALCPA